MHGARLTFVPRKLSALNVKSTIKISGLSFERTSRLGYSVAHKVAFHFYYARRCFVVALWPGSVLNVQRIARSRSYLRSGIAISISLPTPRPHISPVPGRSRLHDSAMSLSWDLRDRRRIVIRNKAIPCSLYHVVRGISRYRTRSRFLRPHGREDSFVRSPSPLRFFFPSLFS